MADWVGEDGRPGLGRAGAGAFVGFGELGGGHSAGRVVRVRMVSGKSGDGGGGVWKGWCVRGRQLCDYKDRGRRVRR